MLARGSLGRVVYAESVSAGSEEHRDGLDHRGGVRKQTRTIHEELRGTHAVQAQRVVPRPVDLEEAAPAYRERPIGGRWWNLVVHMERRIDPQEHRGTTWRPSLIVDAQQATRWHT